MIWRLLKRLLFGLALLLVAPLLAATWIEVLVFRGRSERMFTACKELLALFPTVLGQYLRAAYYWACCASVSWDVCMLLGAMIAHRRTVIGRRVVIGSYSIIGHASIADDVLISSRVSLVSGKYQHGRPTERGAHEPASGHYETIRIGRNSWIGEGAVILANVGENCTVGAGASLYRDAANGSTLVGNPARRVDLPFKPDQRSPGVPPPTSDPS